MTTPRDLLHPKDLEEARTDRRPGTGYALASLFSAVVHSRSISYHDAGPAEIMNGIGLWFAYLAFRIVPLG